jgi:hypothetical protein
MEFIERTNLATLYYLNQMTFSDMKNSHVFDKCIKKKDSTEQYNKIMNYINKMIKTRGEMKHLYNFTLKTNWDTGGRLFCGSSIQAVSCVIRGALFKHTTDFDFQNCHPKILLYLCKEHNIPHANLEYYCNHRDEILNSEGNKNETKTKILKMVNDNKPNNKLTGFLKELDRECKSIQNNIIKIDEFKDIIDTVPAHKLYNFNGSAVNRILCKYENLILQELIHVANTNELEICAPMFDGLMIYGDYYNEQGDAIINQATELINNKYKNLNIVITLKEHNNSIVVPTDFEIPKLAPTIDEFVIQNGLQSKIYSTIKESFEIQHFKIINKSIFIKLFEDNSVSYMTKNELIVSYEHINYAEVIMDKNGNCITTNKKFITEWVKDCDILKYEDVGIYPPPLKCPKNIYNLWNDFAGEKMLDDYEEKQDELQQILKHILILCDNEEHISKYFIQWMAQMLQFPAVKSICPTFISREGAGKGTLLQILRRLMGSKKVLESTKPSRDVWGNFNGVMKNSFLVNLNELTAKETTESEGVIKGLITDNALQINEKGVNQYEVKSYHRFIVTTNKEEPIKTKFGDRRNFIIRSSDELCGKKGYFDDIYKIIEDDDVIATLYNYLMKLPYMEMFNLLDIPQTQYQSDLNELSVDPIVLYITEYTQENYYYKNDAKEPIMEIFSNEFYKKFIKWCKSRNILYDVSAIKFGVRLKRLNLQGIEKGRHTNKGNTMYLHFDKIKKSLKIEVCDDIEDNTDGEVEEE